MNEMRKLMEAVKLNESNSDAANQLEEIYQEIKSMMWEAREVARRGFGYDSTGYERAKYWISAIETALDKDHDWLGGNMFTMADTIQELRGEPDEADEYMEEDVENADYGFDYPSEFFDYLEAKIKQDDNLRIEDRWETRDGEAMSVFNDATAVRGEIIVNESGDYENDGVQFYMEREGHTLDDHYFEDYDTSVADQIFDLLTMSMENTIGRRPF